MSDNLPQRKQTIVDYMRVSGENKEANRLENCATRTLVYEDPDTQHIVLSKNFCNSRFCPLCGQRRRNDLRKKVQHCIDSHPHEKTRFLTLTIRTKPRESLAHADKRLRDAFGRFRRMPSWKNHVKGYYARYEYTYNQTKLIWHPHIHLLLHGYYWPADNLRDTWLHVAPDSPVVDIRLVFGSAPEEVTKYVTKAQLKRNYPWHELMDVLRKRRLHAFGGTWRSLAAHYNDQKEKRNLKYIGTLFQFFDLSKIGPPDYESYRHLIQIYIWRDYYSPDEELVPDDALAILRTRYDPSITGPAIDSGIVWLHTPPTLIL